LLADLARETGPKADVTVQNRIDRVIFSNHDGADPIEPGKRSGQPCVRGLRITAWDILSWLAAGMSEQEILEDYPELESEDFRAVYEFAARMGRRVAL
jgi:uncharacterized protein (DUF433 family)